MAAQVVRTLVQRTEVAGADIEDLIVGCAFPEAESDSEYFFIPHFGYNWMLASDKSIGVSVYGNGGLNTNYSESVFGAGSTGVDTVSTQHFC